MNSGIYQVLNTANRHRYIGSAVDLSRRFREHERGLRLGKHHCQPLQRAWAKYGADAFEFQPVMLCEPSETLAWEQRYIDEFKPEYNVALNVHAPMTGRKRTAESKARMSLIMVGKNVGKKHPPRSPEHCAQISARQRGLKRKPLSPEHRAQISAHFKRMPRTPEHCARISASMQGNTNGRKQ